MPASQTSIAKNFYVVSYWKKDSQKIVCGDVSLSQGSVML